MKRKEKTFELECPYRDCPGKIFMITREISDEGNKEPVKEVIECIHCHRLSTYAIPVEYVETGEIIRGADTIKGIPLSRE